MQQLRRWLVASLPFFGHRTLRLLRRHIRTLPLIVVLGLVAAAMEGLGIGLLIPILTTLQGSSGVPPAGLTTWMSGYAELFDDRNRLPVLCLTIVVLIVIKCSVLYATHAHVASVDGRMDHDLRLELARQLMRVGFPFFFEQPPGRLLNIISSDTWRTSAAIREGCNALVSITTVVVFGLLLIALSWRLTFVTAAGVTLIYVVRHLMSKRLMPRSAEFAEANSLLSSRMLEVVDSARLVRAFGRESDEVRRFGEASDRVRTTHLALDRIMTRIPPTMELLQTVLFVSILLGAWHTGHGFGVLAAFMVLLYRLQPQFQVIATTYTRLQAWSGPLSEVEWLLDPSGKPSGPSGDVPYERFRDRIVFKNVCFSYGDGRRGDHAVLENASFTIKKGQAVALIGASGSGKSTVINLLCRLFEPVSGEIFVDGQPLRSLCPADWRARIALAGQDLDLLEGTIAYNIGYGNEQATRADIEAAARLADAYEFISAFPDHFDTVVGPHGKTLSGGQRQRIALARALVRKPDILILDEATNAVDGPSETVIVEALRKAVHPMTIIVISHRRSTVRYCDEAIVIEGGRVVERGPLCSSWDTELAN